MTILKNVRAAVTTTAVRIQLICSIYVQATSKEINSGISMSSNQIHDCKGPSRKIAQCVLFFRYLLLLQQLLLDIESALSIIALRDYPVYLIIEL